jgi:hypothetical protein
MKKFILLCLIFYATNAFAADCLLREKYEYQMFGWTGACVNGVVRGEGTGKTTYTTVIGKYEVYPWGTEQTGFFYEYSPGFGTKKIEAYKNDDVTTGSNYGKTLIYRFECVEGCTPYISKNSLWVNTGSSTYKDHKVPLETLLNVQYAELRKMGVDTMTPEVFKNYLLAEERQIASAEQRKLDMVEDPPVAGIKLSLGGEGDLPVKAKKKSKKKN